MRTSEKILLVFLVFGILLLGSFVGWKYYENASAKSQSTNAAVSRNNSAGWSKQDSLSVRTTPYYSMMLNKKGEGQGQTGLPVDENVNKNSPVPAEIVEDTNSNTNSNPGSFVKANLSQETSKSNSNIAQSTSTSPTVPQNQLAFSFAVIGDTQEFKKDDANGPFKSTVSNILKSNAGLVMTVGDLVSSCDKDDCAEHLSIWKQVAAPILSKTKMVMGNHDRTGGDSSDKSWQEAFDLPTNGPDGYSELVYSFDWENAHFVILNSEKPESHIINKVQRDWLENDLERNININKNIFVFFHEPAYPVSSKKKESLDVNEPDRDELWNILKKYKVTAVFSGHEHIMSRRSVDGIYQFIIGNTDAFDHDSPKPGVAEYAYRGYHYGIVTVKGEEVTVNIYKVDGSLLDSFLIPR